MESPTLPFNDVAMLPQDGDSAALAKRLLAQGSRVAVGQNDNVVTLTAPCLEGHRFAVKPVAAGEPLLSWGLPFGHAIGPIAPGDVLLNDKMAVALSGRLISNGSGRHPQEESSAIRQLLETQAVNFVDLDVSPDSPFRLEDHGFTAVGMNETTTTDAAAEERAFLGYRRPHGRGVGTRNHVVVIALTASASPLIVPFRSRWRHYDETHESFDGVCLVAHTEGENSGDDVPRNMVHIHRFLAGFLTHMNVGAAVVVTTGRERHVTRDTLLSFVQQCNIKAESEGRCPVYPLSCFESPFTQFVQVHGEMSDMALQLDQAVGDAVTHATNGIQRELCPLSSLCIALQCGGSDAFSGMTGNPLAGDVAARLIANYAGRAILAESSELIGAEPYILSRVANQDVAKQFIKTTENYKNFGARHGMSVAGNPSGGNLYRGLYNIVLKSLGAARKKPPSIALDCVLEYGEPLRGRDGDDDGLPHYAFMDSPGNDLESIAGQVASGCNVIIFITGNGALTNFPFVPTIKVVTTSRRYDLLKDEMDVDAGPYGHGGNDRSDAVDELFDLCVRIASGEERSKGEAAGHYQVSVWRNWSFGPEETRSSKDTTEIKHHVKLQLCSQEEPHLVHPDPPPLPDFLLQETAIERVPEDFTKPTSANVLRPWSSGASFAIIPTSLCSSAIAASIVDHISETYGDSHHIVCPSHTEGCGAEGDEVYEQRYQRLMLGHALHPSIGRALFLEHGCEKTHNDYFLNCLREAGVLDIDKSAELASIFGFCSLQGGGGFENAQRSVSEYLFGSSLLPNRSVGRVFGIPWSSRPVAVGLLVDAMVAASDGQLLASALATIVRFLSQVHVDTVFPSNSPMLPKGMEKSGTYSPAPGRYADQTQSPSATSDMEDFFAPCAPKATRKPSKKKQNTIVDESVSTLFVAETLAAAAVPHPTLLAGQMINQQATKTTGGLHVMDIPNGATWDETVSCLGPACDVMLLVADSSEMSLLPGSCLAPTLRRMTPPETSDSHAWHQWTIDTCTELIDILRSPLVAGGDTDDPDKVTSLQKSLFSMTSFVVSRDHAISV